MIRTPLLLSLLASLLSFPAVAQHRVLLQGNDKLAIVDEAGKIEWEMPWKAIHDVHLLDNGNIMVQLPKTSGLAEIDLDTKKVVWSYNAALRNGNEGKPVQVHAFQALGGGRFMVAESGPGRIIEIDRDGKLLKTTKLALDTPNPHRDTRLARKIANGNYLACHEGDGAVREYDGETGELAWEYRIPLFGKKPAKGHGPGSFGNQVFSALRLDNGNTLIGTGNGHSVLEVTPEKEIVWSIHQKDLPGITLAWVTTLEVLPNGNIVIGNCHAGPGQPLLVEVERDTKKVVWTFDHYDTFGNSVSNSLLLDQAGKSMR